MATQEGKGSILFKLIIVVLVVILILVINIPGKIWSEEQVIMMKSWSNMASAIPLSASTKSTASGRSSSGSDR